jgi:hypothetical protein
MGGTWHGGGHEEQSGRGDEPCKVLLLFIVCSQELEESSIKKELEERRKVLDHDRMIIFVDC